MEFSNLEKKSGFVFLFKLTDANQAGKYELVMNSGDVLEVSFDMYFDDDTNSSDSEYLEEETFHTLSFIIQDIKKDVTKHYKKGHVVLVNPLNMPASYKLL
jgi:hypothetical protein